MSGAPRKPALCHDCQVPEVAGWVHADSVTKLCQHLATYTQTKWNDVDQDALNGSIRYTDAEAGEWFEYPIVGKPQLLFALARDVGTDVVLVKVTGEFDEVLAARIDTVVEIL